MCWDQKLHPTLRSILRLRTLYFSDGLRQLRKSINWLLMIMMSGMQPNPGSTFYSSEKTRLGHTKQPLLTIASTDRDCLLRTVLHCN